MKKKFDLKKEGILFWVTGLQGSGKTTISKRIKNEIEKLYGKTLFFDGDLLRNFFDLNDYSEEGRLKLDASYSKFCQHIVKSKINLIFATVSMNHKIREYNKKKYHNYFEIYIRRKKLFRKKSRVNIFKLISKDKVELPKNSDITISNNSNINLAVKKIISKIKKININDK
jgi:adenylylsulfate kinase